MFSPLLFYKCLADETRLKCLMLLQSEGELCVCELIEATGESQPKVSRHLAQLRQCGLLIDRRQGQWVYYSIDPNLPGWVKKVLAETTLSNPLFLGDCLNKLSCMSGRPKRATACC